MRLSKRCFVFAFIVLLFAITCSNFLVPPPDMSHKLNEVNSFEMMEEVFFSASSSSVSLISYQLPESPAARNLAQIQEYLRSRIFRVFLFLVPIILIASILLRKSFQRIFSLADLRANKKISHIALCIGWHAPPKEA